jgi:pimeloyl-ACP methyl ester carboxylesterase
VSLWQINQGQKLLIATEAQKSGGLHSVFQCFSGKINMEKILTIQGKKIFYRVLGAGRPVILIHGFGEDGTVWNSAAEYLKENFLVIIPDLPGSGKSSLTDDMSMEGMADVIKTILDCESSNTPTLGSKGASPRGGRVGAIGHSMGGYITLAFAEKYPDYLNGFGLFHSTAYADSEEKKEARKKGIEFIRRQGAYEFLKTLIPNLFSPESRKRMPETIEDLIARGNNFSAAALVSYYEAMMQRPDRTEVLKKAKAPVLFVMGKHDTVIPMNDMLKQCHLPEKSYIHILEKSGHMGMIEEAGASSRILEEFLVKF